MASGPLEDVGKLILRLSLGVLVLLHGLAKVSGGISSIAGMVSSAGLPESLAYGVYLGELVGPILLILGFYARVGAVLIGANMVFAIGLVHLGELSQLTQTGGWALELQGMYLFTAVALVLTGPGRIGLKAD